MNKFYHWVSLSCLMKRSSLPLHCLPFCQYLVPSPLPESCMTGESCLWPWWRPHSAFSCSGTPPHCAPLLLTRHSVSWCVQVSTGYSGLRHALDKLVDIFRYFRKKPHNKTMQYKPCCWFLSFLIQFFRSANIFWYVRGTQEPKKAKSNLEPRGMAYFGGNRQSCSNKKWDTNDQIAGEQNS